MAVVERTGNESYGAIQQPQQQQSFAVLIKPKAGIGQQEKHKTSPPSSVSAFSDCGQIRDGYRRMISANGIRLGLGQPQPPPTITIVQPGATRLDESHLIDDVRSLCSILASNSKEKYTTCVSPEQFESAQNLLYEQRGFCLRREPKKISNSGTGRNDVGVFVSKGRVPENAIVAIYPGTVYQPREKAFLQPRGNPFVYRCLDSTLIDGNDRAVSKLIYRSCTLRDRATPHLMNDMTWLTPIPANPLAIGQYVDERPPDAAANVFHQEINLPMEQFSAPLRRFIPNVPFSNVNGSRTLRMVLLIASRGIKEGEEVTVNAPSLPSF